MRSIEKQMLQAWNNNQNFKNSKTEVRFRYGVTSVYLFDNLIARKDYKGAKFTLAGWNTVTTRGRLRALGCNVTCKNGVPYRDGEIWYTDFN